MDLDYLLCPYSSKEEITERWKQYLKDNSRPSTNDEMNKLSFELIQKYKVPPESIRSLFNRSYKPTPPRSYPKSKIIDSKGIEALDNFIFSDKDLVDEIIAKLTKENSEEDEDEVRFGPNNPDPIDPEDLEKVSGWCHENSEDLDFGNFNHGMYRCECFVAIPEESFECSTCKKIIMFSDEEFTRKPISKDGYGGWGDFFCSELCMHMIK